jgi:hypothetical protein
MNENFNMGLSVFVITSSEGLSNPWWTMQKKYLALPLARHQVCTPRSIE